MWKKLLAVLLIVIGLLLVFSNQISDFYVLSKQEEVTKQSAVLKPEKIKENISSSLPSSKAQESLYDFSQVKPLGVNASLSDFFKKREESRDFAEDYIIGIMRIPDVDMDISILKGVLNDNLYLGCGTVREDQTMGEGNYTLAGHMMRQRGLLFNRIPDLENGTKVYITDKYKIYVYEVYNKLKVDETELGMIDDDIAFEKGHPVLSLMTCFGDGSTGERIFVQAELKEVRDYSETAFDNLMKE